MLQRPNFTSQALAAEGVRPAPSLAQNDLYANYQPPTPPPASGSVALAYPVNHHSRSYPVVNMEPTDPALLNPRRQGAAKQ